MKSSQLLLSLVVASLALAQTQHAFAALPTSPLAVRLDAIGQALQASMIWASPGAELQSPFVAFRKGVTLNSAPRTARLDIFADVRYMLWINGEYVVRGPARFEPSGPEYDTIDPARFLKSGANSVVVLALGNQSNGKMRHHAPGFTLRLQADGKDVLKSDETWKWSDQTRYRSPRVSWGNAMDRIDARVENGDWTLPDYNDALWKASVNVDGTQWGPLTARRIPLLRETDVAPTFANGQALPVTMVAGQKLAFTLPHMIQAYTAIEIDADAGTHITLDYAGIDYIARRGVQTYISSDTHGIFNGTITVVSGHATIRSLKLIERLYPFDVTGSFHSNDDDLNKLWALCARSCQIFSEDSYVDCADRERTEWMDDDPPGFDIARTAMTGVSDDGTPVCSDPRLLGEMIRRTALTVQPGGWVKAHTCSDRFDKHAKMEDRACDWVEGSRRYYDATGDKDRIREIWPVIVQQMNYFLDLRTPRGLVLAREWEVWGNPVGYLTCEGAGLNAFIYGALVDAAYLGHAIGENGQGHKFDQAAQDLAKAFNTVLWDDADQTYYSGYITELDGEGHLAKSKLAVANNLIAPTMYPALFALDQGIVPQERRALVTAYLMAHRSEADASQMMLYYYLHKQLYASKTDAMDTAVLTDFRQHWKGMIAWPAQTTWEGLTGGSKAHIYGMFPGYFLSAYVLGVRPDGPVWAKHLLIEPRPGDLTSAEGTVMTEYGPVPVSWKVTPGGMDMTVTVPKSTQGTLILPSYKFAGASAVIDGHAVTDLSKQIVVASGPHKIVVTSRATSTH